MPQVVDIHAGIVRATVEPTQLDLRGVVTAAGVAEAAAPLRPRAIGRDRPVLKVLCDAAGALAVAASLADLGVSPRVHVLHARHAVVLAAAVRAIAVRTVLAVSEAAGRVVIISLSDAAGGQARHGLVRTIRPGAIRVCRRGIARTSFDARVVASDGGGPERGQVIATHRLSLVDEWITAVPIGPMRRRSRLTPRSSLG